MAIANHIASPSESVPLMPAHLKRLFRAFVTPQRGSDGERTFFVEALTHQAAGKKIAATIAALEYGKLFEAEEAIYNLNSASELIHDGISSDLEARIFECGWSGGRVIAWVPSPIFLVRDSEALVKAWARVVGGAR